jgi:hypothetical protein
MPSIWFDPQSAASTFGITVGGNPRFERGELTWGIPAAARDQGAFTLRTGGAIDRIVGRLSCAVDEPYPVEGMDGSNEPAVGSIEWSGNPDYPFFVSLNASQDYFFEVRGLAGQGALPYVLLEFKDGCGITSEGWDNINAKRVPITQYSLSYEYVPGATG